ncbi:hypothetical protein [Engelhardtia mirabilis]|uniref:Yip1 domain protein n=1 Tax=Engelhardtia mirabilis TaxID=2528011 RepID=A0A518BJF5_9BACT|nr:hypothetical protein Pla133_21510 [Planctomycetes bacterium Pla133]QDV01400.1 hypothetical protein Pla86_21510 [Planctomycetes bacterium Pla86]
MGRPSLASWLWEVLCAVFSLESRLPRTVVGLTLDPGGFARAHAAGRRVVSVAPLHYALATSGLWFLAIAFVHPGGTDSLDADQGELVEFIVSHGQALNLVLLPVIAGAFQLCFLGTRTRYVEHLWLTLYFAGHIFLWRALLVLAAGLAGGPEELFVLADQIVFLVYLCWALWGFHSGTSGRVSRAIRIVASILCVSVVSGLATALVLGLMGIDPLDLGADSGAPALGGAANSTPAPTAAGPINSGATGAR